MAKEQDFFAPEDICAHCGDDYSQHYGAMSPPIYQTSLFLLGENNPYCYSRVGNPTLDVFERKMAALENGDRALVVMSGMAAITTAIFSRVRLGDHIVMVKTAYGPARAFASYLERFGISVTFVGGALSDFEKALRPKTKLFYLESPSSGIFELQDLAAVSALARANGVATIIDNTYSSPIYQKPLDLGVDIVVHSASKYLGGHSDVVAGVIVGRGETINQLADSRTMFGNAAPPIQAWLLQRSLRTLAIRMPVHSKGALAVAEYLECHPQVEKVYYPALKSHPQHELYLRQMTGAGGLLSFKPRGTYPARKKFFERLRVFQNGPSWGGYDSLAYDLGSLRPPDENTNETFDGGVIRLYIGLEALDTLLGDLEYALQALSME